MPDLSVRSATYMLGVVLTFDTITVKAACFQNDNIIYCSDYRGCRLAHEVGCSD